MNAAHRGGRVTRPAEGWLGAILGACPFFANASVESAPGASLGRPIQRVLQDSDRICQRTSASGRLAKTALTGALLHTPAHRQTSKPGPARSAGPDQGPGVLPKRHGRVAQFAGRAERRGDLIRHQRVHPSLIADHLRVGSICPVGSCHYGCSTAHRPHRADYQRGHANPQW